MAALVEQSHDENGIIWPASVAPYDVHVVVLTGAEEIGAQAAEALSARRARTCCSTTATSARVRSSPTPT